MKPARAEINGKGTRVLGDTAFLELVFQCRRLRGLTQKAQGVGQKPLGFGEMIQGCGLSERCDGGLGFAGGEFDSPKCKQSRRAVGLHLQSDGNGMFGGGNITGLKLEQSQAGIRPSRRFGVERTAGLGGHRHGVHGTRQIARDPAPRDCKPASPGAD
jgi:hypothetical protein